LARVSWELPPSGSLSGLFGLRNGIGVHRQLHCVALDGADQLLVDEVVMTLVARRAVLLGQLDAITLDMIDGADRRAVLADDLHVLSDFHWASSLFWFDKTGRGSVFQ